MKIKQANLSTFDENYAESSRKEDPFRKAPFKNSTTSHYPEQNISKTAVNKLYEEVPAAQPVSNLASACVSAFQPYIRPPDPFVSAPFEQHHRSSSNSRESKDKENKNSIGSRSGSSQRKLKTKSSSQKGSEEESFSSSSSSSSTSITPTEAILNTTKYEKKAVK